MDHLSVRTRFPWPCKIGFFGHSSLRPLRDDDKNRLHQFFHFRDITEMITKPAIAFAQTYFAVQTRKQEKKEQRLLDVARVSAREKLTKSEKKLSGIIYERGVDENSFATIRSKGDQALFGGFTTADMKKKLGVPAGRALADFLPTLTIKAKDFATELTSHGFLVILNILKSKIFWDYNTILL